MKNAHGMLITCLAGLAAVSMVVAQEGAPGQRQGGAAAQGAIWGGMPGDEQAHVGMMMERILGDPDLIQKVGLTDEQVKTLRSGILDSKKEQIRLKADMDIASVEQADKMSQSDINEKDLMKAVEKVGNLGIQLAKSRLKEVLLVKKTLTPDQIKKIREVAREVRKQRMNEGKDNKKMEGKEHRKDNKGGDQKDKEDQGAPPEDAKP